jgi:hypothetical protein
MKDDLDKLTDELFNNGEKSRKVFEQYLEECDVEWSYEEIEKFRIASEILIQNKKDCDQFKGRDGL